MVEATIEQHVLAAISAAIQIHHDPESSTAVCIRPRSSFVSTGPGPPMALLASKRATRRLRPLSIIRGACVDCAGWHQLTRRDAGKSGPWGDSSEEAYDELSPTFARVLLRGLDGERWALRVGVESEPPHRFRYVSRWPAPEGVVTRPATDADVHAFG